MIFAGLSLARRLEAAEALNGVACAESHRKLNSNLGTALLEVSGGAAIFVGAGSPLSRAIGLGMQGPVRGEDLGQVEAFYRSRAAAVTVDLCPLADISLLELIQSRSYRIAEFNNVLVRMLAGTELPPAIERSHVSIADDEQLWALTVGRGFLEKDALTADELDVGRTIFHMEGSLCYLAYRDGQPAAAGAMTARNGLALMFADSTLPSHRSVGLHAALIRERLCAALARGCDMATATTLPGSISQRNYERYGFHVAYTKAVLTR